MKRMILLAITFALIAGAMTQQEQGVSAILDSMSGQPQKEIFKAFHYLNEKTYELNSQEGLNKYKTFKQNLAWIEQQNAKEGEQIYGITQFSDMTHEEYVATLTKPEVMKAHIDAFETSSRRFLHEEHHDHHDHHDHHEHHHHDDHHDIHAKSSGDGHNLKEKTERDGHNLKEKTERDGHNLKASYPNWMKYDGPVKDQKTCGACWAFAVLAAVESQYTKLKGVYTPFSEQYLVDCDNLDGGCNGGWPRSTFRWIGDNGIIHQNALNYVAKVGACDAAKKVYEYKIVEGALYHSPQAYWSQGTFEELLAKGPVAVAMDASFRGMSQYRPGTSFRPMRTRGCTTSVTHAVTVVGKVLENGKEYYIFRNSWGKTWGMGGYGKMPVGDCMMDNWGWVAKVYNGFAPDNKHPPKPEPVASDCVEVLRSTSEGFDASVVMKACDSQINFGGRSIGSVRFPEKTISPDGLRVGLFYYSKCYGKGNKYDQFITAENSLEFPKLDGVQQWSSSMAFLKKPEEGCVQFHTEECLKGESSYSICNDIKDSQDVQLGGLINTKSINIDTIKISKIVFYTEAQYRGQGYELSVPAYNIGSNWQVKSMLKGNKVRSIKIFRR